MRPRRQVVDSILAFWAKVERAPGDGCWEWTGSRDLTGYGVVRLDGQLQKAHRVAWMLATGRQPGMRLRHLCGNAGCVNPGHLGPPPPQLHGANRGIATPETVPTPLRSGERPLTDLSPLTSSAPAGP